jgi:hypothetical protein
MATALKDESENVIMVAQQSHPWQFHSFCAAALVGLMPFIGITPAQAGVLDAVFQNRGPSSAQRGTGGGAAVRAGRPQGGTNATIPYLVSPRHTWLTGQPFSIRWHPVADAESYVVRLWRWSYGRNAKDLLLWSMTTQEPQVDYTAVSLLEPGYYYSLEVVTDTGLSSELDEGAAQDGFELLFPEDWEIVQARLALWEAPWESPDLSETDRTLLMARVYVQHQLLADAINLLEPLVAEEIQEPLVHAALGEVYSYAGLNTLAQQQYEQALALAQTLNQTLAQTPTQEQNGELDITPNQLLEAEALSILGLAEISTVLGDQSQALTLLEQALERYETLGDRDQVIRLKRQIILIEQAN